MSATKTRQQSSWPLAPVFTEAIGTFFLTLTILVAAVAGTAGQLAPIAIGGVLTVLVYAGGPTSGAHYNPAVTLALTAHGALPPRRTLPYLAAQLIGAALAALVAAGLGESPLQLLASLGSGGPVTGASVLSELLFTFLLVWVIFNVAVLRSDAPWFGVAIGGTVMVAALTVGPISGAVLNPAVAVGLLLAGNLDLVTALVFIGIQLAAGMLARVVVAGTNRS